MRGLNLPYRRDDEVKYPQEVARGVHFGTRAERLVTLRSNMVRCSPHTCICTYSGLVLHARYSIYTAGCQAQNISNLVQAAAVVEHTKYFAREASGRL